MNDSKEVLFLSPSRNRLLRYVPLAIFGLFIVAIVYLILLDLQPVFEYRKIKNRIEALVPLGSDMDAIEEVLRDEGFELYGKHFATVQEDYYWIEVKVFHKRRSIVADALGHMYIYLYYNYVVIEAGLDSRVRRVF